MPDPRSEYADRLARRRAEVARLQRRDRALSTARLILFAATGAVGYATLGPRVASAWWMLAPAIAFVVLVALHGRALDARRVVERAVAFYERGIERLDHQWAGKGNDGQRFDDPHHPYARDLDLFGKGSLFELLCTTRTHAGEETLAAWLRAPAAADEVRARQAAIAELRDRLDLREELAILGADVRAEVDPNALSAWALAPPSLTQTWLRPVLGVLALAATVTLIGWLGFGFGWSPLVAVVALELIAVRPLKPAVQSVSRGVDRAGQHLAVLAVVLARLEREPFQSARLVELKSRLAGDGQAASARIAQLGQLAHFLSAERNQFFAPFAFLLQWGAQFAFAIEAWRTRSGAAIPRWLEAVGELEALCALSGYAYEHPQDPFPTLSDDGGACFDGAALGHPLLPDAGCVRNDVRLTEGLALLLVSGSNMSGKSTLLRTVGSNAVLALAGAPVRAASLRLSPLQVGATLRVQDSLAEGASRFYAEITRLRLLVDRAAGQPPLLFLLDEILAGTNSHDRRLGAEAVVKGLVERGAIGLVTTHDLALTELATALPGRAENVHFEDTLSDGKLVFDYRMRPGVVRKSNALELMRAVGLEV
jgi:hypothetical protein